MRLITITALLILSGLWPVQAQQQKSERREQLSDSALLTLVQQRTFNYFWKFAHPVSRSGAGAYHHA
jgi:hypothetical protein